MRLLRVIRSTAPESGGPIEALLRTSEVLIRNGHEVEVASLETPAAALEHGLPFPVTALGRGVGKYGYNTHFAPWFEKNAGRFDAVILHGLWNYASFGAWRALRHLGIPYFIYTHGMMDPWFRSAYPLKHIAKQVYWTVGEGRVLRDAQAVFFTSEEEKVRARHVFLGHPYTERVVLYGTADPSGNPEAEKAAFAEAHPELAGRRFVLFLGRIHPKKGCDLLIRAFAAALAQLPRDLDLVIGGPDQVGLIRELGRLAARHGIGDRVHWPGMLKGALKWGALRSAEAMILPSHQENFGVAVVEAMACEKPVLISDKVNIWREVEAAGAGLVAPDTQAGSQDLLLRFFSLSQEQRANMGAAARQTYLESFNIEAAGRDLMSAIGFSDPAPASSRISTGQIEPSVLSNSRNHGPISTTSSFDPARQTGSMGKPLKLLHVIRDTDPTTGGPVEAIARFSDVWKRDGHQVEVVALESSQDAGKNGLKLPVFALGHGAGHYGYNPRLTAWLRENAPRFDAIILHGLWNYSSFGSWRALKELSTPYFIFTHGMMDPWFRSEYPIKHVAKQLFWWFGEGRVLRDARAVLFTCEEEKVRSRNVFSGPGYRERVVLLGTSDPPGQVEQEKAAFRNAFPALANKRFLLFISRIHPKKGCDLLIHAFAQCAAQHPDVHLAVAGPDQLGWSRQLISLANNLGIGARVHWPGMLRGDLKWGAFRCAEAMILPSHQENFGFVVAEAMACSTPVLVTDKVNIWREVDQANAGLVEGDTTEGVRQLLVRFLALSAEERRQMASAARQGFLHYFDIEVAARSFVNMIESEIVPTPSR